MAHVFEHSVAARPTQMMSHAELQQPGSISHTRSQHCVSLQAGMPFASLHSPALGSPHLPLLVSSHEKLAKSAQVVSQISEQQNGSARHTNSQHFPIEHDGVAFAIKQLPAADAPQSEEQSVSA